MRISRLELKGAGVFENETIEFKEKPKTEEDKADIHIFTGNNGTGKKHFTLCYCWVCRYKFLLQKDFKILKAV